MPLLLASTSRILQFGQMALTMSRSSEISSLQLTLAPGSGDAAPDWLTFVKHPDPEVQAGSP